MLGQELFADEATDEQLPGDAALREAEELIYDAWATPRKRERVALARRALEISALCADAHVILAQDATKNLIEARRHFEAGVAAGEQALGPETFEINAGDFWSILETRPYMRARVGLASCLWDLGQRTDAIGHLQELLRLNPGDNQGLRYLLCAWLLTVRDHDALDTLLSAFDEDSTQWLYTRALLAFRRLGASAEAGAALRAAWNSNAFVPGILLDPKRLGKRMPDFYAMGTKEEAILYLVDNMENWAASEGALTWLYETTRNLVPPKR